MKTIYLIRHGQASFGSENYDCLSTLGEKQATMLASHLAHQERQPDTIFTGSMLRHKQTAKPTISGLSCDNVNEIEQWNEFDHQGIIATKYPEFKSATAMLKHINTAENPSATLKKIFTGAMLDWVNNVNANSDIESWSQFKQRVANALKATVEQTEKCSLVFTSGGPISYAAGQLMGLHDEGCMKLNWGLVNIGITKLLVRNERVMLSSLNDHAHLDSQHNNQFITYK